MAKIYHAHLWGSREDKYSYLQENDVNTVEWTEIFPNSPFYLFSPQNHNLLFEYNQGWKITDIMPANGWGIATRKDYLLVDFTREESINKFQDIAALNPQAAISKYEIKETPHWSFIEAKLQMSNSIENSVKQVLFRPFDIRFIYYEKCMIERGDHRFELMSHLLQDNISLITVRRSEIAGVPQHFYSSNHISVLHSTSSKEGNFVFPLYLYPDTENAQGTLFIERTPNLSQNFLSAIRTKLGYIPTPEAIFYYIYAIFHSPTYRQRYAEFLKIDFPRVPLTSNDRLFKDLGEKGQELVELHLMKSKKLNKIITKVGGDGDNAVTEVTYKPTEQRVYINKNRYFEGILPEVWSFKIGGYQVLDKWLKDRKKANRTLSFDDVLHYQKIVVALKETMQLMTAIDRIIPGFPIE